MNAKRSAGFLSLILSCLFFYNNQSLAQNRFWVGSSGNWSDVINWSATSGGPGGASVPTAAENVFFNALANGAGTAAFTVTLDVPAVCNTLSFTGLDGLLTMNGAEGLTVNGSVTTVANWAPTFTGRFTLSGLTPSVTNTINFSGQSFAGGIDVFAGASNVTWQNIAGTLSAGASIRLRNGTLNTNGNPVNAPSISANDAGNLPRGLIVGSSTVTLTGAGTVVDFTDNLSTFSLTPGTGTFNLSNIGAVTVVTGNSTKTMPALNFSVAGSTALVQSSATVGNTITFNSITCAKTGFTVTGSGNVAYTALNFPVSSTVALGGGNVTFSNAFLVTAGSTFTFNNTGTVVFNNTFTAASTSAHTFTSAVTGISFNSLVSYQGVSANLNNSGNITFSVAATITQSAGTVSFNNTGVTAFNANVNLGPSVTFRLSGLGSTVVTATSNFLLSGNCGAVANYVTINATSGTALVSFANPQVWSNARVGSLNVTGSVQVNIGNVNLGGNVNVTFGTGATPRTLFWVGGTGNWNSIANWSASSGGIGGQCIPTAIDNVVFDANSFSVAGQTVTINTSAECFSMNWTGVTNTPTLAGTSNLTVSRDMIMSPAMNVSYTGFLTLNTTGTATISMQNRTFAQVAFNGPGTFNLTSTFNSTSFFLNEGIINTNDNTINIVNFRSTSGANPVTFNAGNSIINCSGDLHQILKTNFTGNFGTSTINFNFSTGPTTFTATSVPVVFANISVNTGQQCSFSLTNALAYGFGNINVTSSSSFTTSHSGIKTFNGVTTGTNASVNIAGNNTFNGPIVIGSVTLGSVNNRFNGTNTFNNTIVISGPTENSDRNHFYNSRFNSTVTVNGNDARVQFHNNCNFYGSVNVQNQTSGLPAIRFMNTDTLFAGFNLGNSAFATFTTANAANTRTVFYGIVTIGNNIATNNCLSNRDIEFYQPVRIGNNTSILFGEAVTGARTTFRDSAVIGNNCTMRFRRLNRFIGPYVQGTGGTIRFSEFSDTTRFDAPVTFGGGHGELRFHRTTFFSSTLTIGNGTANIVCNENVDASSGSNIMRFGGDVLLGNNCQFFLQRGAIFSANLTSGTGTQLNTNENGGTAALNFSRFDGNVNVLGGTVRFRRANTFNANLQVGPATNVTFNENGGNVNFSGAPTTAFCRFGAGSVAIFNTGTANTFRNFIMDENVRVIFNNNGIVNTFRTIQFNRFNIVFFNTGAGSNNIVTNGLSDANTCGSWNFIRSNVPHTRFNFALGTIDSLVEMIVLDINSTNQELRVFSGVNVANNAGAIAFFSARIPRTYYWVPGVANTTNWSDSTNWSLVSGDVSATNARQCIPTPIDSVVFDVNSFTPARRTVTLDRLESYCKGMHWVGGWPVANNPTLAGPGGHTLNIFGEIHMASFGQMNVTFTGTVEFNAAETTVKRVNGNSIQFNGPFIFNGAVGNWIVVSSLDLRGANGSITMRRGRLDGNSSIGRSIALTGSFIVETNDTTITQFRPGLSTVTFRGNTSGVDILMRRNDFYNLVINKDANTQIVEIRGDSFADSLRIRNNLTITTGRLSDAGNGYNEGPYQIIGNTTGTGILSIGAAGVLDIGRSGDFAGGADIGTPGFVASSGAFPNTVFPRGWDNSQIAINAAGTVVYRRHGFQPVSHVPTYGILELFNPNGCGTEPCRRLRYATGEITFVGGLILRNGITFADSGYQLTGSATATLLLEANAELQLGNEGNGPPPLSPTTFPLNLVNANINMNVNSTVIYNSSRNGVAQNIRSLTGAGNQSYPNLIIRSAQAFRGNGGAPSITRFTTGPVRRKLLLGNILVRGNLTIENNNQLDVSGASYAIEIRGNWLAQPNAQFVAQNGTVSFTDGNSQTYQAPTTNHAMYTVTINKSGNNVTLNSPLTVSNRANFRARYFVATSTNFFEFLDDAIVGTGLDAPTNASHVNGWIRKVGNDAFSFPVGDGSVYRLIGISAPTDVATVFATNYINGPAPHPLTGGVLPVSVERISVAEHWNLNRVVGTSPNSDVRVTLSWVFPNSGGVRAFDSLVVVRWNGAAWIDHGPDIPAVAPGGRTGNNAAGTVTTTSALSSFSPFTLGSRSLFVFNPLPVSILQFNAVPSGSNTLVFWETVQERGISSYRVERSTNGVDFAQIAQVNALQKDSQQRYSIVDKTPARGVNYYRLRSVEVSGTSDLSEIVSVFHEGGHASKLSVFPNPGIGDQIMVREIASGIPIKLLNISTETGQFVYRDNSTSGNFMHELVVRFDPKLSPGLYIATIQAEGSDQLSRVKFVVQ